MSDTVVIIQQTPPNVVVEVGVQGPPGQNSGIIGNVNADATIPLNQVYTIANPTADCVVTLPPISAILVSSLTTSYVVKNISQFNVRVQGSAGDQTEFAAYADIKFQDGAVTFVASQYGWVII